MPITIAVGSRSFFVTATAWVFILLGVVASLSALVQNAMLASLLPSLSSAPAASGVVGLLMNYLPWVVGTGLVMSLATLASAIGLLLRLDWARRAFIILLAIAIVANLLGLWLQQEMMQ
ncbi:MAG: hypothetical protein ABI605_23255, partial [Rhizobacter sp.]